LAVEAVLLSGKRLEKSEPMEPKTECEAAVEEIEDDMSARGPKHKHDSFTKGGGLTANPEEKRARLDI
jgi:hypothetical protein